MKRILIGILLLAAMLAGTMNVWAAEAEISVQVRTSKTQVQVGDTVEYTVLATGSGVVAMQFEIRLPEGLRYVPNSGATPENLAQKLGVPAADWTEQSMMFTFYNDIGITFAKDTEILRFSCVAEQAGDWEVELYELLPFNGDFEEFTPKLQVQKVYVGGEENQVTTTVPQEKLPAETPEMPSAGAVSEEMVTPSEQEEPMESTAPEEVDPEQMDPPVEEGIIADPPELEDDFTTIGASPSTELKEENTNSTTLWVLIIAGVSVVAIGAVVFILLKKKRV